MNFKLNFSLHNAACDILPEDINNTILPSINCEVSGTIKDSFGFDIGKWEMEEGTKTMNCKDCTHVNVCHYYIRVEAVILERPIGHNFRIREASKVYESLAKICKNFDLQPDQPSGHGETESAMS